MTKSAVPGAAPVGPGRVTGGDRAGLLRLMTLARAAEQRARSLVAGEDDAGPAVRRHREAIGAAAAVALAAEDRLIAPGRYLAAHLGRGDDASVGASSTAPDLVPLAVGVAVALAARREPNVVLTLLDEGAMAGDRWTEALALATQMRLPLVLVVEQRAPTGANARAASRATAAKSLPLLGEAVDVDDPEAVLTATRAAVERARAERGPTLITCVGAADGRRRRLWGRGWADRRRRRPDPVEGYARRLLHSGLPRSEIEAIMLSAEEEVAPWPP